MGTGPSAAYAPGWLIPHDLIHYVSETKVTCAPLSDHKLISIYFDGCKGSTIRGYWKFNKSPF